METTHSRPGDVDTNSVNRRGRASAGAKMLSRGDRRVAADPGHPGGGRDVGQRELSGAHPEHQALGRIEVLQGREVTGFSWPEEKLAGRAKVEAGANVAVFGLGGIGLNAHPDSGMPGEVVGIPVRPSLAEDPEGTLAAGARTKWNLAELPTVLITGGSQGAASINRAVAGAVEDLAKDFQLLHAYGKKNDEPAAHPNYAALPYIEDMGSALAVADLVVCRSGAMTVAEVSAAGLPAIYVPLPHGNGEQALNSREVVEAGAAIQIPDAELTPERLISEVRCILDDPKRLASMTHAAAHASAGDVANTIADRIAARVSEAEDAAGRKDK